MLLEITKLYTKVILLADMDRQFSTSARSQVIFQTLAYFQTSLKFKFD